MNKNIKFILLWIPNRFQPINFSDCLKTNTSLERAKNIVQYYYYYLFFLAVSVLLPLWSNYFLDRQKIFSPLWPIFWVQYVSYATALNIILFLFLGGCMLGCLFYWKRNARLAAFIGLWQFHSLYSSFGQPNHQWYLWFFVSLFLIFIPNMQKRDSDATYEVRRNYLYIIWIAQIFVLLTYSLSGLGKVYNAFLQYMAGEITAFSPEAFAYHIAFWLPRIQVESIFGPFLIEHPWIGWPLFVGGVYIQFFAIVAAFRPSLQKFWALGLIFFHIGTFVTMYISFMPPVLLLLLLFFDSPFREAEQSWKKTLLELPIFGKLFALMTRHPHMN